MSSRLIARAQGKVRRLLATRLYCNTVDVALKRPVVSFTFDDAPRSAFETGGEILAKHGARGTYYICLGLEGRHTEVGEIGSQMHFEGALKAGHELGCHTFDHLDAWEVPADAYLASVDRNRDALSMAVPEFRFETFAYPKSGATARVKSRLADHFAGCRGGGQDANIGTVDLYQIKACFLDRRTGIDLATVRTLLARTAQHGGWLVFATHDIVSDPTRYGCAPEFFDAVVREAGEVGAEFRPVAEVCRMLARAG